MHLQLVIQSFYFNYYYCLYIYKLFFILFYFTVSPLVLPRTHPPPPPKKKNLAIITRRISLRYFAYFLFIYFVLFYFFRFCFKAKSWSKFFFFGNFFTNNNFRELGYGVEADLEGAEGSPERSSYLLQRR